MMVRSVQCLLPSASWGGATFIDTWCSELAPDVFVQVSSEGKISNSMVWCSELVPVKDVQVTREDAAVTGAVGKISCSMV